MTKAEELRGEISKIIPDVNFEIIIREGILRNSEILIASLNGKKMIAVVSGNMDFYGVSYEPKELCCLEAYETVPDKIFHSKQEAVDYIIERLFEI